MRQPGHGRLPLRLHLLVLAGFVLLTLVFTYPIPLRLFSEVPGGGDAWQNVWNLWWVKTAVLNGQNPYHTDLLYYPQGVNLYLHTLVLTAGLIGIPLQLLGLNLIATYNLVLLSSFVLAGYGTFLLCRYLTGHAWASFVGGVVFAFSPYHFAHMFGHMNLASLQGIPFYVLLLLKALDARGIRPGSVEAPSAPAELPPGRPRMDVAGAPVELSTGVKGTEVVEGSTSALVGSRYAGRRGLGYAAGAGALLAVNAYTDLAYALFLVMLTGLVLAWRVLLPLERRRFVEAGLGWREGAARLAAAGGVFLLLLSPILLPTLAEAQSGYAQQPPLETLVYSSDAILAFTPSELHPIWGSAVQRRISTLGPYLPIKNPSERVVFLGYTVLALAALAVWKLRKERAVWMWAFVALVTWVLSLGPILQLYGESRFTAFGVTVPLPYLLLFKLPLFSIMRTPARLTVLTMLALALLVAFSMAWLMRRFSSRDWRYLAISVGAPALVLFEFLSIPFPTVPPGWNVPIYSQIAKEPGRFALLELPLRPFGDYMAYQTIHGKPIIGGYLARQPPYAFVEQTPALRYLQETTTPSDPARSLVEGGRGVKALKDAGVKYIIIRWWAFSSDKKADMRQKLATLLGGRLPDFSYPADQVDVWQLSP